MVRAYEGNRVRVNFYFDEDVFIGLKRVAALKGMTYSEALRQAAREYVARHTSQAQADHTKLKDLIK
ncbi:MAG TPA: CopG family transcriptional regulator [Acidobacteriaceae bacterium]|nr:CopG family transcriptional regulator [Acidobacteriaceae bacterium]